MAVKRGVLKPFRLNYWRPDRPDGAYDRRRYVIGDWAFLGILFFLALIGLPARGASGSPPTGRTSRCGRRSAGSSATACATIGLADAEAAERAHRRLVGARCRRALLRGRRFPFTKARAHARGPGRRRGAGRAARPAPSAAPGRREARGGRLRDASRRSRRGTCVDLDACTKCGKCHEACPATASGLPALAARPDSRPARGRRGLARATRDARRRAALRREAADRGTIRPDTLWSCMQCMACVEICPVGIEHVPIINQMRRGARRAGRDRQPAAVDAGDDLHVGQLVRRGAGASAPAGRGSSTSRSRTPARSRSTCSGSSATTRRSTRATSATRRRSRACSSQAGVDFGILYDAERTAGNDVRRAGEEGLFGVARRGEHRDDLALRVHPHPDQRPAHLQHAQERVPGSSARRGRPTRSCTTPQLLLELLEAGR